MSREGETYDDDRYAILQTGMLEFGYEITISGRTARVKGVGPRRGFSSKTTYRSNIAALEGELATLASMRAEREGERS